MLHPVLHNKTVVISTQLVFKNHHLSAALLTNQSWLLFFNSESYMKRVDKSYCFFTQHVQGFHSNRIGNSITLFWTRAFSQAGQLGPTTQDSDVQWGIHPNPKSQKWKLGFRGCLYYYCNYYHYHYYYYISNASNDGVKS